MVMLIRAAKIAASVMALAIISATNAPSIAKADDATPYPTTIVGQNAPVGLTRCTGVKGSHSIRHTVDVVNHKHDKFLLKYVVRWTALNHSGKVVRQDDVHYYLVTALAPGGTFRNYPESTYLAPASEPAVARLTCRMQSAYFDGGKSWTFGDRW